eukprot:TRINITY_DN504_c0_g1_i1.p1 TRINITY_DN504_c0_g1~~TRINITY_DN504_c0_g1_i1.p1  ORF type:complete len:386 (+),score=86.71 TRINITY_DN504_c0_g1_i1:164-1321(+)
MSLAVPSAAVTNERPRTTTQETSGDTKKEMEKLLSHYLPMINSALEKWLPREINQDNIIQICGRPKYEWDVNAINKAVIEPIWDLLDRGGKRWRSTLLLLVAEALGKSAEEVLDFVVITEIVHNGTLIVDDIEDDSEYRRGKPCLHKTVGVDVAINAGNLMYFLPLRVLRERVDLPKEVMLKCYETYSTEMLTLHLGQGLDICWHSKQRDDHSPEPNVANYLQMCANKTGALARMSAKLSALICGGTDEQAEAIGNFAESIGIAFQIQDDLLNLEFDAAVATNKGGVGEDIHEGKRTIMVIHSFDSAPAEEAKRLREILSMHTSDPVLIAEAIDIMRRNKSMEFAQDKARDLIFEAWNGVDTLLPNSTAKSQLRTLVDYLIDRKV